MIPDPRLRPTLTVDEVAVLLGTSRANAYEAARLGQIPVIRVGTRRIVVPTAKFLKMLGLSGDICPRSERGTGLEVEVEPRANAALVVVHPESRVGARV